MKRGINICTHRDYNKNTRRQANTNAETQKAALRVHVHIHMLEERANAELTR